MEDDLAELELTELELSRSEYLKQEFDDQLAAAKIKWQEEAGFEKSIQEAMAEWVKEEGYLKGDESSPTAMRLTGQEAAELYIRGTISAEEAERRGAKLR